MAIERSDDPRAFHDFEHKGWEAVSDGYERHFASLTRQSVEATLAAAGVQPGMRTLDVCTGPGMLARAPLRRGAEAVGLDFSERVVEVARRNVPGADFHQGDAQSLPSKTIASTQSSADTSSYVCRTLKRLLTRCGAYAATRRTHGDKRLGSAKAYKRVWGSLWSHETAWQP